MATRRGHSSEIEKASMEISTTEEKNLFESHLKRLGLKHSKQRHVILDEFLKHHKHLSLEDLHRLARSRDPRIGFSTVFRTMKLLKECGIAREVGLVDGISRFEHHYKHLHHDHLICTSCKTTVEFFVSEIEELQEQIARKHHFKMSNHVMVLYGICRKCYQSGKK
jgi:Fur family ferric uptake transcriptional regulator